MNTKQASEFYLGQKICNDAHLISRAQNGEEAAFATLYELYKRRVYTLCLRISGAAEVAEELTGHVFLRVFSRISAFKEECGLAAALNELAINLAISARHNRQVGHRPIHLAGEGTEPDLT